MTNVIRIPNIDPRTGKDRGGRPRGATDMVSRDLRSKLRSVLEGSVDDVKQWLEAAAAKDPYQGVQGWIALSQYVLPKLTATAVADITPAPAPVRDRIARAGISEQLLLSPRAATLIASGEVENLDQLLDHIADRANETIGTERSGEVIDAEVIDAETEDELLR